MFVWFVDILYGGGVVATPVCLSIPLHVPLFQKINHLLLFKKFGIRILYKNMISVKIGSVTQSYFG
jgi:hypothetical protein